MNDIRVALATAFAASLAVSLLAAPALAQPAPVRGSRPYGVFVGAHGTAATIEPNDEEDGDETVPGAGAGLRLGYGFANGVALFAELTGTRMWPKEGEAYDLGHADVGARYAFASAARRWMPFVEAAFAARASRQDVELYSASSGPPVPPVPAELELRGRAFMLGGGLQWFLSPRWALDAGMRYTNGTFTNAKYTSESGSFENDELDLAATSIRYDVGFVWYPRGGR